MGIPIVLDCDPGHDDAVAILLAVASPEIDLLAVTTTFGNCTVEDATRNALRVLALVGTGDVPVAAGAAGPLTGETALGNYVHGVSGLDGPAMPEPVASPSPEGAVALTARVLAASPTPVTIVATGPITNVARLLVERPELKPAIREIVLMGGSTERGNHTPTAEFNTFADPEALDVVLHSGLAVRMVGLNLTHQALATPDVVARMRAMDSDVGRTCAEWMGFFGSSYRSVWQFESPPVHDPCTIAALIRPELITWQQAFVAVELDGRWTRGTTVVDLHHRYDEAPNASVAMTLDVDGFWDLVLGAVRKLGVDGVTAAQGSDVVRLAQELVRMPSTPESGGGQRRIAELLADRLAARGFAVELDAYDEAHANVVARWGDPDRPAICLTGHLDTVSVVETAWTVDPWDAEIRDGLLFGRGSTDMKAGVAALVRVAEEYVAASPADAAPITVVLTAQEEVGSLGALSLAARDGALPDARVLVVAEPTANRPVVGHRGVVWLDLVARGRSCHGSTPHLGENAIEKLLDAVQLVRAWAASHPRDHAVLGGRTLNIGRFTGGLLRNIVPDAARAELDVRTPDPADAVDLPLALQDLVGELATVETVLSLPPVHTDPDDAWVRLLRRLAAAHVELAAAPGVARFFTDASVLTPALGGVPTVICGPGSPDQAHVVDEFCAVSDVVAATQIYAGLLRAASSG